MLSPRTLALRAKNRTLLKALDQFTEKESKNALQTMESKHDKTFGLENNGLYPEFYASFKCSKCIQRYIGNIKDNSTENYAFPTSFNRFQRNPGISSDDDLRTPVHEIIITGVKNSNQRNSPRKIPFASKNFLKRSESHPTMETKRCQSISLEQERAAELQMHAPTHTHSISKCYCTYESSTRVQPDSKYIVQVYGQKQHIPARLKKQRYRADNISKNPRVVRWADNSQENNVRAHEAPSIHQEPSEASHSLSESPQTFSSRLNLVNCQGDSHTSLLEKVKTFRESHWSDCHASPREETYSTHHECLKHYVLNDRLFLEPVHRDEDGQGGCPLCLDSSHKPDESKQNHRDKNTHLKVKTPSSQSSHIIVTLPKYLLEPGKLETRPGRKDKRSCSSKGHISTLDKKKSFACPTDSLALRYQKKDF